MRLWIFVSESRVDYFDNTDSNYLAIIVSNLLFERKIDRKSDHQSIRDRSTLALFCESFGLFDSNQPWIRSFFSFLLTSHIYYWDICKIAAMLAGCHIFHDYVYPFGILQTWEGKVHNCTTSIQWHVVCIRCQSPKFENGF